MQREGEAITNKSFQNYDGGWNLTYQVVHIVSSDILLSVGGFLETSGVTTELCCKNWGNEGTIIILRNMR